VTNRLDLTDLGLLNCRMAGGFRDRWRSQVREVIHVRSQWNTL